MWPAVQLLALLFFSAMLAPNISAQTLNLNFTFNDTGVTTTDSVAGALLTMTNRLAVTSDLHGAVGSGPGGIGKSLDLTSASGANNGSVNATTVAADINDPAINLGTVSTFVQTFWFKNVVKSGSGNSPVLFAMGPGSAARTRLLPATANTIGFSQNTSGNPNFWAGTTTINDTTVTSGNLNTNAWYFYALTYDGSNYRIYAGTETTAATLVNTVAAAGKTLAFGATGSLLLGNRGDLARSYYGWLAGFRFYNGTGSQTFVESVRLASLPDPLVGPTLISPTNNPVYAGTLTTLNAIYAGTPPFTSFVWQSDGQTGGTTWTNLPGSTTNAYALSTTNLPAGTYKFRLIVSSLVGTTTNTPASLTLSNASGPIIVANTTLTPSPAPVGGNVVLGATFDGSQPIYYQWLFTDTNGVKTYLSGATNNVFTLANVQYANAGSYSLIASNNPGGVPALLTNTPATLTVRAPYTISDFGTTDPVPGADDIAQLLTNNIAKGGSAANGLGYYNNNTPGQTFTTGSNPNGYSLIAVYLKSAGIDGSGSLGNDTLRIYSVTNSGAGAAVLLSTYTSDNQLAYTSGHWLRMVGMTNVLQPNTTYAYMYKGGAGFDLMGWASNSPSYYSGGELASIPAAGGAMTFGASHNLDGTFLINLVPSGFPAVQSVGISPASSPASPVYGGQPVTLSVQAIGSAPLYYDWQTDDGLGGSFSDLPGSNTNAFVVDTTSLAAGTYNYQVVVTNSFGSATSSVVTLNLLAASAPVVTTNTILTPVGLFAGGGVSMRAAFSGTPPISYQWMFDNGSGAVAIPGATSANYSLANAQPTNGGYYFLTATNRIAPYTSSSSPVFLTVSPVPQTNTTLAAVLDGGNAAPPVQTYDIAQLVSAPPTLVPGLNYFVDNSSPPGQTFTTGTNPPTAAGYVLNSIWLQAELSTIGSGGNSPQTYTLGIYSVSSTNVSLLTAYVSTNTLGITDGNWIQWIGLTNVLATNTTYAFSLHRNGNGWWKLGNNSTATDVYADGQAVSLPASGAGTLVYSTDPTIDAAFLIGLTPPSAPFILQDTKITPANCYAGNPVTMQAYFSGSVPIRYQWQFTDTNGVGPVNLPGATNNFYTIASVSHAHAGTYSCLASNNAGGVPSATNSTPATLTVPTPPSYFVSDYSYSTFSGAHYSGQGVIGTGYYWNTIDTTGGSQSGLNDDGSTDLFTSFASTRTWDFHHGGGSDLLAYYMLNQGSSQTTFAMKNLPNGVYNLVLYACNGHYQYSQTAFTVGGITQNALATTDWEFVQNNNYVVFTNVVVTNGIINGIWQKAGSPEAALNGLQVELGYAYENPAVNITTQPANEVVAAGQPASFGAVASGPPPLRYQWRADGIAITGATNSTLAFLPPTIANTLPNYDVVVTSPSAGLAATSSVVTLTIRPSVDSLVWRGYGIKWDLSGANWFNTVTSADPAPYQQGDVVLLDDTTTGNLTVYLIGRLMPGSVTVANTNYTFAGPGYLSWHMALNVSSAAGLTLTGANDYTGNTTLGDGATLTLSGAGSIGSSSNLILGAGATLSATARTDATLTVNPTQTLRGNGTYNVTGSVANNGTLEFKVSRLAGVVTNDRLQGMTGITYGGKLLLDLSGEPLAIGDALKLFNASAYTGAFASLVPPTPGTGLLWNTNTMATDGTLRVVSAVNTTPTNIISMVSGNSLALSWPADHTGWRLQTQTNALVSGLSTNWVDVAGTEATNQVMVPIIPANGTVFFRLIYP